MCENINKSAWKTSLHPSRPSSPCSSQGSTTLSPRDSIKVPSDSRQDSLDKAAGVVRQEGLDPNDPKSHRESGKGQGPAMKGHTSPTAPGSRREPSAGRPPRCVKFELLMECLCELVICRTDAARSEGFEGLNFVYNR